MHSVDNFYPHRLHAMSCKSSLRWSLTDMVAHDSASPRIDFGRNTSAKFLNSCFSLFLLTRQRRVQTSATTGSENSLFLGNFYSSLFMRIGIFFNQYRQNINKHFFVYNIQSLFFSRLSVSYLNFPYPTYRTKIAENTKQSRVISKGSYS